jgi:hypothetical protein
MRTQLCLYDNIFFLAMTYNYFRSGKLLEEMPKKLQFAVRKIVVWWRDTWHIVCLGNVVSWAFGNWNKVCWATREFATLLFIFVSRRCWITFFSFKTTEHMWTLNDMKPVVSKLKWRCWFGKPIFTSCTWKKIFALRNYSTMHVLFHGEPPYKWHKLFSKYLRKTQKPSWQLNSGPSRAPQYSTKKNAHLFRYHTEETMKAHQPEVASGQTFLCGV